MGCWRNCALCETKQGMDMNREDTKEAIKVMQAYVDGIEVVFANVGEDIWVKKTASIMWDFVHYRYRSKPKPREWEIIPSRLSLATRRPDERECEYIKVREVL